MIYDLTNEKEPTELTSDVAIIGAGIAGLILADRLTQSGIKTIVLESGSTSQGGELAKLNSVEQLSRVYRGAEEGRTRGLGGTSSLWGGALLPFTPEDFQSRPDLKRDAWPISFQDIEKYTHDVEKLFGIEPGPYEVSLPNAQNCSNKNFSAREAKWPTFKNRNVATLLDKKLNSKSGFDVWTNATVTSIETEQNTTVKEIIAKSVSGESIRLKAKKYVICSGAIEATRLLLLLDRRTNAHLTKDGSSLGRFFQDHLSLPLAEIETNSAAKLNELAGYRFDKNTMRSLRFELSAQAQKDLKSGSAFVHIAPRPLGETGFDHLRDFVRSIQKRKPSIRALVKSIFFMSYLIKVASWRILKKKLYWPKPAVYEVHVVIEQASLSNNRISLSNTADLFMQPKAAIDWNISHLDVDSFRKVASYFDAYWKNNFQNYGRVKWYKKPTEIISDDIETAGDIYPPVGTTRMGLTPGDSVVNKDLAVHHIPNLYVAATSVFPNCAGANPTMTLIMLTMRLADHLKEDFR